MKVSRFLLCAISVLLPLLGSVRLAEAQHTYASIQYDLFLLSPKLYKDRSAALSSLSRAAEIKGPQVQLLYGSSLCQDLRKTKKRATRESGWLDRARSSIDPISSHLLQVDHMTAVLLRELSTEISPQQRKNIQSSPLFTFFKGLSNADPDCCNRDNKSCCYGNDPASLEFDKLLGPLHPTFLIKLPDASPFRDNIPGAKIVAACRQSLKAP